MKQLLLIILTASVVSCTENKETTHEEGSSKSSEIAKPTLPDSTQISSQQLDGCYMKLTGKDTAILMLSQKENEITGKLLYDNFEKDGSRGIVKGKEDAGIIKLWYDFNSEGVRSVMEAYFKKENGRLLRGIGSMDVKTDTTYFISGVNYSDKETFTKVDCDLIKWKMEW